VGDANSRGRGIGKEIVRSALRIAFDELGMHRVGLGVFSHNTAALACYEGVGFRREGTLRDYRQYGDQYLDLIMMSMLEEEWRATRPKPAL
jgi:RimJ/RimL family protein N-acetyltransferase